MEKIEYADLISGIWITREELIEQVKACPEFSHPDEVVVEDSEGTSYTGRDLCTMAGVTLQTQE